MAAGTASLLLCSPAPRRRCISASVSDVTSPGAPTTTLPLRQIPGGYGLPLIGPVRDRLVYFYSEGGRDEFFRSRIRRYGSTVFRTNIPPGPPIAADPRVIALLDAACFPALFDTALVEKRDLFTGTYVPDPDFTGGHRVLSYLDPSEPQHAPLKNLLFHLLASRRRFILPEFRRTFGSLFHSLESDIAGKSGVADFVPANESASFDFLAGALFSTNPANTSLGGDGPKLINKWVLFQLGPILTLGLPSILEDLTLHTLRLPPAFLKSEYRRLCDFFSSAAASPLDEAERMGISRDEALHNIVFAVCFNTFGGMKTLFPNLIKWIGRAGGGLHARLAAEIRSAVKTLGNGEVTMKAIEGMPLLKSVVYETLRIEPPVPVQYGRAKRDFVLNSHDAAYQVQAGEMLFGYQPFATKDPRVFERAEEFVADRFVGESGQRLLKYVVWSNGPETESPTPENKQCAGKDFVELVARLLVVELFLRYDSFDVEVGKAAIGSSVKVKSLRPATF